MDFEDNAAKPNDNVLNVFGGLYVKITPPKNMSVNIYYRYKISLVILSLLIYLRSCTIF